MLLLCLIMITELVSVVNLYDKITLIQSWLFLMYYNYNFFIYFSAR